ncbi:hypothetical protein AAGS40_28505 (plasmid) [Paraburkholderia sp. PREW-6R]|uniref:hypothetical protein n=1 Tax=Paraburkholderia sp. PREW-6R TaxID=3141544 RepID=UPI0031F59FE6
MREQLANEEFVELADASGLVWKKTPDRVAAGRDYALPDFESARERRLRPCRETQGSSFSRAGFSCAA